MLLNRFFNTNLKLTHVQVCQAMVRISFSALQQRDTGSGNDKIIGKPTGGRRRRRRSAVAWSPFKPSDVNPDIEWSSVYTRPRPFDPYIIPLSVRMGRAEKGSVTPPAVGNLELIKIPNFLHLTPIHIQKHCEALKPLCTPWPSRLPSLPLKIETRNYVFPGHSIKHAGASKVVLTFNLDNLVLSDRARKKMIEIAGLRYNSAAGTIQLVGKRCPTRKQNHDYVMYLLKVLYLESNRLEPWEEEKCAG